MNLLLTHIPATFVSHRRGQRRLRPNQAILTINNVLDRTTAEKYIRNALLFTYQNKEGETINNYGFIRAVHGNKGAVRAAFDRNLNPKAYGQTVYVKLYKLDE